MVQFWVLIFTESSDRFSGLLMLTIAEVKDIVSRNAVSFYQLKFVTAETWIDLCKPSPQTLILKWDTKTEQSKSLKKNLFYLVAELFSLAILKINVWTSNSTVDQTKISWIPIPCDFM